MNSHSIAFAYHSGKIENDKITYHDTREIFEHDGVTSYTGDLRTLFEIRNGKEAYELFLTAFGERRAMDESLIREIQQKLTQNTYDTRRYQMGERPGEYKRHDYVTGKEEVGAPPEDVAEEMGELLEELLGIPDRNALTVAAYFHAKFENIHPFAEGNGRTQRLYCQQLCKNTRNFYLDFSMADKGEMLEASMDSFMCNYEKMEALIRKCIKEVKSPEQKALENLQHFRKSTDVEIDYKAELAKGREKKYE